MRHGFWTAGTAVAMALGVGAVVAVSVLPPRANAACCYFAAQEKDINQPGQKAFIAWEASKKIEAFTVQPKFEGNALEFGMVIPTPSQPKLDEMPRDFFKDLAIYTILMPLPSQIYSELYPVPPMEKGSAPGGSPLQDEAVSKDRNGVHVLESGVVGSLDYKIISAEQANGLFDWLKENKYTYSGDEATLDFYIKKHWIFTVMKIDSKQMKKNPDGSYLGEITPTRFTFSSDKCIYPLKITQISVKTETDALFYVQAADEMDMEGDLSWKHSYRVMWLTYMLGCSANADQQAELQQRTAWVEAKKKKDPKFETTKLEWAKKLGEAEIAVLDDPLKNYAQMGGGTMPEGSKVVTQEEFLKTVWENFEKKNKGSETTDYPKKQLEWLRTAYPADKGAIVHSEKTQSRWAAEWMWYPKREAPDEDVKGLSRLKGMLQKGQWLTKIRKILRKDEMTDDLVLIPVQAGAEDEYVRIMPTSPP
ncbi:MAG: DUF2330 domain-containing protein [Planctomycetes bacterium]|nr:DUF2330 domain-containing protein [Planctomycetota bacterium]